MSDGKTMADLVVIGGGPGGYACAFLAADLGLDVTLVDAGQAPGGVCLHRGCIPSKALLHVARVLAEAREISRCGVDFGEPEIDVPKLRSWKESVVDRMAGGLVGLAKRRKVRFVQGRAGFTSGDTLSVDLAEGGTETLAFGHAVIATGSVPISLPGLDPAQNKAVWNSTSALDLEDVPGSLLVIGGGYIGLELGTVYAALGSRVTVVEMLEGLLPGADRDLVKPLARRLEESFESIQLETRAAVVGPEGGGLRMRHERLGAGDGEEAYEAVYDAVLVAVGRRPNTVGLKLENTSIQVDEKGFVMVNQQCRTADERVFAIGDVVGEPMLAHKATYEGRVVAEVLAGRDARVEAQAIPAVVFTDPEIAWCGLSEGEARSEGRSVSVSCFPWAASGRAVAMARDEGLTKVLADPKTGRVLGIGMVGPGAGEMIAEGVLAIEMAATVEDLSLSIHPHPTLSETLMEAAEAIHGTALHLYRPPRR